MDEGMNGAADPLIRFYFGDVGADERDRCERLLRTDAEALETFLTFKRDYEETEAGSEQPSPLLAKRLQRSLWRELAPWRRVQAHPWKIAGLVAMAAGIALAIWWGPAAYQRHSQGLHEPTSPAARAVIDDSGEPRESYTL